MPVYLVHGFRWPREGFTGVRVHAVVHNLDDCSVEYIQNEHSRVEILASFRRAWPDIMKELDGPGGGHSKLEFIEQHDPEDLDGPNAVSQPYAYVADKVVLIAARPGTGPQAPGPVTTTTQQQAGTAAGPASGGHSTPPKTPSHHSKKPLSPPPPTLPPPTPVAKSAPFTSPAAPDITALSVNVDEVIAEGPGTSAKAWEAFADLRDKLAEGEKIGWWVVYNGDPDRSYDEDDVDVDVDDDGEGYDQETVEDDPLDNVEYDDKAQRQAQPQPARPRNTLADNTATHNRQPVQASMPHIATQQQQTLTALPVRPAPPEATAPTTRTDKGKHKESIPEPAKLKETAKSQGLRKKFFGKRL
ncbi:hypothetical protein A1O3_06655 [Capronia epimyces CBS 606.96]|uniref:Uncharacterized protein n=1 Tax=Capronia epimyces CBS 606.96 TaxID=1182542 RepID=W9XZS3_9EURO|nr:uncharacterized protein A1O3_06655 [Capronia epimyces CBS 606.96]EXJ82840.1 hypothetical protein A1O3_06655 [Capronia epimyces CBS 606.96]